MSKYEGQQPGPTWQDVHDYADDLKARFSVHIVFNVSFYTSGKPPRRSASVVAEGRVSQAVGAAVRGRGISAFRGNAGAATMPAAMWTALSELEGALAGIEKVAQDRLPF